MIFPNRIIKDFGVRTLLFILIASSIPHIHANTNPENPELLVHEQNAESSSINDAPAPILDVNNPASSDVTATQNPVELQLNILAGMCEHIMDALEKGKWNLLHDETQKKYLSDATLDTLTAASHLLKTFKDAKLDTTTHYLYTLVVHHQLELLNNLLLRRPLAESNLEEQLKAEQTKEKTIEELAQLIVKANASFEQLHYTLQDLDAANPDSLTDSQAKKEISALDRTNDQVLKQLCSVDAILEELALFIDNDSLQVSDKRGALTAIRNARAIIEGRKYDRGQVTEASIYDTLALNKYMISHVREMIGDDFNTIPLLDQAIYTTRTKREIAFEELDQHYQNNETVLAELRAESQNAGLKNYHLFFRTLGSWWTNGFDGGRRVFYPVLGGFAATAGCHLLGLWPTDWQNWDFKIPFTNTWFYGQPWGRASALAIPQPPVAENIGLIGSVTNYGEVLFRNPIINNPATWAAYYGAGDWKLTKQFTHECFTKLSTFLLGRKEAKDRSILTHVEPKYTFKDVVGQYEIKNTLSTIVRYFEDPQGIDNRGLKLEKGYLFTGKTRSGKSFMAEALAGEIRAALKRVGKDEKTFRFIVAPAEILRQSGGFHLCMEHARRYAPCILFIDEIHLLDLQAGKNNALLGEFLTELSGCMSNDPESKVFVIAATNHEDALDKALRQSGRLGKEIRFEYPTYADRRAFTVSILEKRTINVQSDKWSRAINQFSRETEDCTYEDIRKTIEDAFVTAKFNGESIEPEHLNQSFDKNIRGIIPVHDHEVSEQERHIIAAHQAGYVLATKILAPHLSIAKVTMQPIREGIKERSLWSQWNEKTDEPKNDRVIYGKLFTYGKKTRDMLVTTQENVNACIIALSGYAAGNVQLGAANNSSSYLPEKRQEAFNIAKISIAKGINLDEFNDNLKHEFLKRALVLRSSCESKALMLMEQNKEALNALYTAILKHGALTGKAIDTILAEHQLNGLASDQNLLNLIDHAFMNA